MRVHSFGRVSTFTKVFEHNKETIFQLQPLLTMKNHRRMLLIILVAALQLIALLVCTGVFFQWLRESARASVMSKIRSKNICYIDHAVCQIRRMGLEDLTHDSVDHQKLQAFVKRTKIPNNGFLVIVDDRKGKVVCHPRLKSEAVQDSEWCDYCRSIHTKEQVSSGSPDCQNSALTSLLADSSAMRAGGKVKYQNTLHCVDAQRITELGIIVMANQLCTDRHSAIAAVSKIKKIAFYTTLIVGFLNFGLVYVLVSRFEATALDNESQLQSEVQSRKSQLVKTQSAIIFGLAKLAESRDTDTGEHLERIRKYVTILANDLATRFEEIDDAYIQNLGLASSLHDIGKVGIPDAILLKPGRLTPEERALMQLHAPMGGECLEAIGDRLGKNDFLQMAREVAYWHHERWDGTGYPHQLAATAIPISARIVSVADVYDALTSRRPYKEPMSHEKSREIIVGGAGSQFDPEVVEAFLRHQEEFQTIASQYNNDEAEKPVAMLLAEKLAAVTENEVQLNNV